VDDQAQNLAFRVLHGTRTMPERPVEDAYFTAD
jgi:hypothetical protein